MCRPDDFPPYDRAPLHSDALCDRSPCACPCPSCRYIAEMIAAVRAEDERKNARTPRDDTNPMEA